MKLGVTRRHNRWYEQLLLSQGLMAMLGWLLTVAVPYLLSWSWNALWHPDEGQRTALIVTSLAYGVAHGAVAKIRVLYPGGRAAGFIAPVVLIVYGVFALATFMFYLSVSRYLLLSSCMCALVWMYGLYLLTYRNLRLKLAVIPGGKYTKDLLAQTVADIRPLKTLSLDGVRYDGVVADFEYIDESTQKFLTYCALNRTAVYDAKDIYESLTGRVKIDRMSENKMGALLPSPFFETIKRCMDIGVVVLTLPVTLVIGAIVAVLIKLDSPGPVIYTQTRIGQGNRLFTLYKFRSMYFVDQSAPKRLTAKNDARVTRVGRIIRKLRIDELPQFFNVLKGEMSLIGPRPELPNFAAKYEEKTPFYSYRHIVKPGISGWAQVRHGHAASIEEAQIKLEHDFYYIKHCSLSLDVIILLMTIRTICNGFGAR